MLVLSAFDQALAPALLVAGILFCVMPFFRPDHPWARAALLTGCIILSWRYVAWRFEETIPPLELAVQPIAAWLFALIEAGTVLSSTFAFAVLSRTRERTSEVERHLAWWRPGQAPMVDILIATYNEDRPILERTIVGALASDHPRLRVWVLDDSRRPWLRELTEELGARYLTRPDNRHAKAGNINNALRHLATLDEPPDFVAVLDADFVPHADFVGRALALFHDPTVGLVQTPQHFFNPDPIQFNLGISRAYPDEQRFFFDHIQPARDAWSIAFCCGTSSMMRWSGLQSIGGFPTDSVTEDFLVTIKLRDVGLSTVYLNEPLTEGLAPEGLKEYITQRGRWCLGLMQIVRGPLGPFKRNRLRLIDRIGLLDSFLYWATTYPFRVACILAPLVYWFGGIVLVDASVPGVLANFLPYFLAVIVTLNWLSGGLIVPVLNDVSQLLGANEINRAVYQGLFRPHGQAFKVTAKGGDRDRVVVQWPLLRLYAGAFALTVLGMSLGFLSDYAAEGGAGDGLLIILFWSVYNLVILAVAMVVCIELPRTQDTLRRWVDRVVVVDGSTNSLAWLSDLTLAGGRLRGFDAPAGHEITLEHPRLGTIRAQVTDPSDDGCIVAFQLEPAQRAAAIREIHTRTGASGTQATRVSLLLDNLLGRAMRSD